MLISVIIPVYNAEEHLEACLDSICHQNFSDYEVILVDDGSKDSSAEICDKYCSKFSNCVVFHNSNMGVASARNFGLSKANGDYICFMDSDDVADVDFIAKEYQLLHDSNSDYAVGAFSLLEGEKTGAVIDYIPKHISLFGIGEYLEIMKEYHTEAYFGANWGKLYKHSIITDNDILFEPDVQLAEDFRFNLKYLKFVKNISVCHDSVYQYRIDTSNSLSKKRKDITRYWREYLELYKRYKDLYIESGLYGAYKQDVNLFLIKACNSILRNELSYGISGLSNVRKTMSEMSNENEFAEIEVDKLDRKYKRIYKAIKNKSPVYSFYLWGLNVRQKAIKKIRSL